MWGSLGNLAFGLLGGPYEFQDHQEADYAEIPVLGDAPRLQAVGRKLEEITLKIRLHPLTSDNPDQDLQTLRDAMLQAAVQDLVIGQQQSGIYAGRFVIASLDHDRLEQWPDGTLKLAEVTVKLKEWVETPGLAISSRKKAPAAVRKRGQAAPPATQVQTETRFDKGGESFQVPV
jgi:phage protein U